MKWVAIFLLRGYKLAISPLLPQACRFTPTCSQYAAEAIGKYGFWKGSALGLKRLSRCHPFSEGGYDPMR
jgi:putative membrane protein insertion efficiency factor